MPENKLREPSAQVCKCAADNGADSTPGLAMSGVIRVRLLPAIVLYLLLCGVASSVPYQLIGMGTLICRPRGTQS